MIGMSVYYAIGCHTCETQLDMAGVSRETRVRWVGEFVHKHCFHDIVLANDASCDEDEDIYFKITDYQHEKREG